MVTTSRKWKKETRPASEVWSRKLYDPYDMGKFPFRILASDDDL